MDPPITWPDDDPVNLEKVAAQITAANDLDINAQDGDGRTLLTLAAKCGNLPLIRLLLERDYVDANAVDIDGMTPLGQVA
ncbi:oxysterol binding protein [Penicillium atrosanguineum]|uniref:Oxysterol binding protein n=1 Tax=Penicillium atrosanguineum TaxID=1132637 RepID=A0A9W9U716_9EURO|nr:oxysterol binding protein [Penicillium atrosanguineum]